MSRSWTRVSVLKSGLLLSSPLLQLSPLRKCAHLLRRLSKRRNGIHTQQTPTFLPNFLCSRSFFAFSDLSSIICFEISFFLIWREESIFRPTYCDLWAKEFPETKYFFRHGILSPSACAGLIWPSLQSNRQASWWICHAYSTKEVPLELSPELVGSWRANRSKYKNHDNSIHRKGPSKIKAPYWTTDDHEATHKNISLWKSSSTVTSPLDSPRTPPSTFARTSSAGRLVMSSLSTQGRSLRKSARHSFIASCDTRSVSHHFNNPKFVVFLSFWRSF